MTNKKTPSETIKEDQSNLMTTLESIRALLEQNETKLSAARESISIANANTKNDTSALLNMRSSANHEQIVPILDDIVEIELSSDSLDAIPELDSIFSESVIEHGIEHGLESEFKIHIDTEPLRDTEQKQETHPMQTAIPTEASLDTKPNLATLTVKNLLIDALDNLQMELEESLRESLMKTMVTLEKDLKLKISQKIDSIKTEIGK